MSISFSSRSANPLALAAPVSCNFSEPVPLLTWQPLAQAGVYVILVPDANCTPKPFRPIYFGEAGNFSERGFPTNHHKWSAWVNNAGNPVDLFVATYTMAGSTPEQRRAIESGLCDTYAPACNG